MPWVDNYAHLFGFVFGFLLSFALLPFITFGPYDRQKKIVLVWLCLVSAGILFVALLVLFFTIPVYDCEVCSYFNCVPLTREFCASQNINFKRDEYIVWQKFLRLLTVLFNLHSMYRFFVLPIVFFLCPSPFAQHVEESFSINGIKLIRFVHFWCCLPLTILKTHYVIISKLKNVKENFCAPRNKNNRLR